MQQVQNFSGVCWPAGRRAAVSSQTDWRTSPLSVTTYFHPSSTGFSKDGSNAPQISGSRWESTCPLKASPSVFAVCPLPPEPENGGYICHPRPCKDPLTAGSVIEYLCAEGYMLKGDYKYLTCKDGEWRPAMEVSCHLNEG